MGGTTDERGNESSEVVRLDVATGLWDEMASWTTLEEEAEHFRFCELCEIRGNLYVTGVSVRRYTIATNAWIELAALPDFRPGHRTCAVGGTMYVLGGRSYDTRSHVSTWHDSVLKYDMPRDSWTEVCPMPSAREGFGACVIGECIYVCGGEKEHFVFGTPEFPTATMF